MRPRVDVAENEAYECLGCGRRVEGSGAGRCPACDGLLQRLDRSRDL